MAILRSKEIWEMEIEDIEEKLVELKRTIARVLTIMNQKQKEN